MFNIATHMRGEWISRNAAMRLSARDNPELRAEAG